MGTVVLTISISVRVVPTDDPRGIKGVPEADRIGPVAGNPPEAAPIYVFVPHGEQDFDNGKTPAVPLFSLTVSDVDISVEIVGDLPPQPANSPYTLSVSADKRAILVFRTANPLKAAGSSETIPAIDISFTVRATGENASRYADNVQQFHMSAEQFVEPVVGPLPERGDTDANGALVDLSAINIASDGAESQGKTTYGDFTPTFSETGAVAGFSVSADGVVSVADLTAVGSHTYTVQAVSAGFRGVALFTVSVKVGKLGDVKFNNQRLIVGNGVELDDIEHDTEGPTKDQLFKVNMVYHGERRGLHWIYGDKYYENQNDVKNGTPRTGLSNNKVDWYSRNICETMGNGGGGSPTTWRLPTLIEMAGGVLPDGQTNFVAKVAGSDVVSALGVFEIDGLTTNVPETVNLSVQAVNTGDEGALSSAANLGYFAGLFNASDDTDTTKGYAAHVYYDSEVRVSDARDAANAALAGRVVCVHVTDEHEETAVWAELSVDDSANNDSLSMDGSRSNITADVKLGLGLFTERNQDEPQAVTDPAADAFSVSRLDTHSGFVITPVAVSGGVSPEVSVPSNLDAADIPETGTYTLSASFAPAGDYVGFDQRDFGDNGAGTNGDRQFDLVRLTVDWTKPPVFKGVVALASRTITATAINRISGGSVEGDMVYYGDVGGLHVMVSRNVMSSHPGVGPRLCEDGGGNWRNPTLSELGMLISAPTVNALSLTVQIDVTNRNPDSAKRGAAEGLGIGAPGIAESQEGDYEFELTVPDEDDAQGGIAAVAVAMLDNPHYDAAFNEGEFWALSGLHGNDGEPFVFGLNINTADEAFLEHSSQARRSGGAVVCVSEIDAATYDTAGAHNQLAGVRIDDGSDKVALAVDAILPSFSANAPAYTITARAFYFNDVLGPPNARAVKIEDLTGLELTANITNNAVFSLTVDTVNTNGEIVIMFGDNDPSSNPGKVEIEVKPPLGEAVILTVNFSSEDSSIGFAGTPLVALSMSVRVLSIDATPDPVSGSPGDRGVNKLDNLSGVDMVYHGESRGLHWMVGEKYYDTVDALEGRAVADGSLKANEAWFSAPICVTKGNLGGNNSDNWRLPTLIELAGGVLPAAETGTEIVARVNGSFEGSNEDLDAFDIVGLAPDIDFLTLTVKAKTGDDDKGQLPESTNPNRGYFAGMFNAGPVSENQRGHPAHVHYDDTGNEVEIAQGDAGRVVCVRETDSYEETPMWAEVSVDDGTDDVDEVNKAMVVLTAAAEMVKANLTVKLGLFNQRGVTAPVLVTRTFTARDLTVTRLDTGNTAFTIELTYEDGGAVVGVSVPQTVTDLPRTGLYTLSAAFAPAGDYFGLAQQRDFGNAGRVSTHETQFYPVELVVNWTAPAQAVAEFTFAGVNLSTTGSKANITADVLDFANFATYDNDIEMEYLGNVGGLRVMFSRDSDASSPGTQLFPGNTHFSDNSLCSEGGNDWRKPTLSELGMIMTPAGVTSMSLTVNTGIPGILSASAANPVVLDLNFADADGGLLDLAGGSFGDEFSTEIRVISGLMYDSSLAGIGFIQSRGQNTDASLVVDHGKNMIAVCVEEIDKDTYDASVNPQLAGVTVSTNLSTGITAPNGTAATGKYTITAQAYYYSSIDSNSFNPIAEFLDDEPLIVKFGDNADDGPFVLKGSDGTTDVKGKTITDGVIVIDFGASEIKDGNTDLEIVVKPSLGEERTLTVEFDVAAPAGSIGFAGTFVAEGMSVQVLSITATDDPVSGSPGDRGVNKLDELSGVDMVYHGESRGLHWMVGEKYYKTEDELEGRAQAAGSLKANEAWFSAPICVTKGNSGDNSDNWRLPTLIELAGGVLPATETRTEITARVNGSFEGSNEDLDAFDIVGLAPDIDFLTLTVKAKTGDDDKGQLPDSTNPNNGYFAGMFNAGPVSENQRGHPAHVHYNDTGNEVEIAQGDAGKVVCVRETDSYEETPVWAEVAVDDGTDIVADANKAMVVLTAAAEMVKANLTVKLGLFNQRGVTAPVPVTRTFTARDLTVTRLDTGNAAFTIELTYEEGGAVVGVSVPQTVTDLPRTGLYTLSAAFAPAGDYFGLAQQRGFGSANRNSGNETQFYPVELVVNWTKPAVADVAAFKFAGVDISSYGQKMTITAEIAEHSGLISNTPLYDDIVMEYHGDVDKLRVMFSRKATSSDGDLFDAGAVFGEDICAAGNTGGVTGWRVPSMSELGMLMTPAGVTGMTLTVVDWVAGARDASDANKVLLDMTFADAEGGLIDYASALGYEVSNPMGVMTRHVESVGNGGMAFGMIPGSENAELSTAKWTWLPCVFKRWRDTMAASTPRC